MMLSQQIQQQQNGIDFLPFLSNIKFGNSLLANLGGSNAVLSGSFLPQQNYDYAQYDPAPFPWLDGPPISQIGDMNIPKQNTPDQISPASPASPAAATGENRLIHYIKLYYIGLGALVLVAIGLYLLSQQTAAGQAIKEKAVEAAKKAGEAAAA